MNATKSPGESQGSSFKSGMIFGFSAYLIWGSFPLIIAALSFAGPWEVVVWRIVFGFLVAAGLTTVTKSWPDIRAVLKNRDLLKWQILATIFIMSNWQIYVLAVASHQTLETALGYFINPLVTILLAVIFLGEKLSLAQKISTTFGAVAVIVLTFDYGRLPWIALSLAASFGIYGLAKNKLGGRVSAVNSFALESGTLLPFALVQLALVATIGGGVQFAAQGVAGSLGLIGFGVMTAVPLILFGSAAKRLPLRYIGFIQYLTPIIQFVIAIWVFHEPMPAARWVGFGLVWIGLAFLAGDAIRKGRSAGSSQSLK